MIQLRIRGAKDKLSKSLDFGLEMTWGQIITGSYMATAAYSCYLKASKALQPIPPRKILVSLILF